MTPFQKIDLNGFLLSMQIREIEKGITAFTSLDVSNSIFHFLPSIIFYRGSIHHLSTTRKKKDLREAVKPS